MMRHKTAIAKGLGYFSYAFLLFTLLAYINFPYDALKNNITNKIEHTIKKPVSIKEISPLFPLGIAIKKISVKNSSNDKNLAIFSAEEIQAKINFASLFSAEKILRFSIKAYGGNISGTCTFKKKNNTDSSIKIHTQVIKINTNNYPLKALKIMKNPISLTISGNSDIEFLFSKKKLSEAHISLQIEKGNIEKITIYSFKLPPVNYENISSTMSFKKNNLTIEKVTMDGKDVQISLDGNIFVKKFIATSTLNLNLKGKISPRYLKEIGIPLELIRGRKKDKKGFMTFKVTGTLKKPRVKL